MIDIEIAGRRIQGNIPDNVKKALTKVIEKYYLDLNKLNSKARIKVEAAYALCDHSFRYLGEERNDHSLWECSKCYYQRSARVWNTKEWGPAPIIS
jgi:hypothetical protein